MFKNVASQTLDFVAIDGTTGLPKTGDAANITMYVSIDDGTLTALTDTSATEISSTNAPGKYRVDVSQAETNGNKLTFSGKSSTSNVVIIAPTIYTRPAEWHTAPARTILGIPAFAPGTIGGLLALEDDGAGNPVIGITVMTVNSAQDCNVESINSVSASSVTTIKPVLGLAVDGVVPTVTNLTNAPTNGDLTTAMKASVNAECDQALADYDAVTRTEATADKDEILAEIDARTLPAAEYATVARQRANFVIDVQAAQPTLTEYDPADDETPLDTYKLQGDPLNPTARVRQ